MKVKMKARKSGLSSACLVASHSEGESLLENASGSGTLNKKIQPTRPEMMPIPIAMAYVHSEACSPRRNASTMFARIAATEFTTETLTRYLP